MPDSVLQRLIESYMATYQDVYSICWQGGEPTLSGIDFFQDVVNYQKKCRRAHSRISNAVQTNATLIDDDIASLFKRYGFLVGCSLDGPAEIHNRYRRTVSGKPTHGNVMKGIRMLNHHHIPFNILTLVSQSNVTHAARVYRYLKKMGFTYHQYIPCVEYDSSGNPLSCAITGDEWGRFLCDIFNAWYPQDIDTVSVRNFETILSKKTDNINSVCTTGDNCCQYFVVEYNGDIYPCDFFVEKSYKLGNIMEDSWHEIQNSRRYRQFGSQKKHWNKKCQACRHLELCAGDCLKNRFYAGRSPEQLSLLCPGLKYFFDRTEARFDKLTAMILQRRQNSIIPSGSTRKTGRNQPCPCGSGFKYKKCCGKS